MKRLLFSVFACMAIFLSACGWDDDSEFEIRTRAIFFLCPDTAGDGLQVVRLDEEGYTASWNSAFGIPNADLSAIGFRQNMLWMSSGVQKTLFEINPVNGQVEQRFNNLSLAPHVFAVGRDQILIADTLAGTMAFLRIKDGDVPFTKTGVHAKTCIYNNGRFYLAHGGDSIAIYDEKALYPRANLAIGATIDELMFDNIYNLRVFSHDSSHRYLAIVTGNGDYISTPNYSVDHSKVRFSPYFYPKFGTEITYDLQLTDSLLATTRLDPLLEPINNFEADFFEGLVYCTWRDSLLTYSFSKDSVLRRIPFPFDMRQAFYQYGGTE